MTIESVIPPVIALILFIFATIITAFQAYRRRAWLLWPLLLSGLLLITAFALRIKHGDLNPADSRDAPNVSFVIIPHAFAAFALQYAVLSLFLRLVWWVAPSPSMLNRRTLWFEPRTAFLCMTGTLFLLACVQSVPINVFVWSGLLGQAILLAVFFAFEGRFWSVSKRWAASVQGETVPGAWRTKGLVSVWVMSGLLELRSILGWVMILVGKEGKFLFIYIVDALPLLVCFILFGCLHPGTYMPVDYIGFRLNHDHIMQTKMADARVVELTRDAHLAMNVSGTTSKAETA